MTTALLYRRRVAKVREGRRRRDLAHYYLADDSPFCEQFDLDSMDWLNFLVRLHAKFGIGIPEADQRQLVTLRDATEDVSTRMEGRCVLPDIGLRG